jgi:hypothetical protein
MNLEVIVMSNEFTPFSTTDCVDVEYRFGRPKVYLAPHELPALSGLRRRRRLDHPLARRARVCPDG